MIAALGLSAQSWWTAQVLERYEDGMGQYLFRVGEDYLDGMESKHMSRYFNHAQHGNLNFTVDVENSRVDFYAMNNIEKGDELTFDCAPMPLRCPAPWTRRMRD